MSDFARDIIQLVLGMLPLLSDPVQLLIAIVVHVIPMYSSLRQG
jgi:hypothetical protein